MPAGQPQELSHRFENLSVNGMRQAVVVVLDYELRTVLIIRLCRRRLLTWRRIRWPQSAQRRVNVRSRLPTVYCLVVFGHAHAAFGVRRNPAASETLFRVLAAYSSKLSSSHMITCPLITLTLYKESEEKRLLNAMLQMMLRAEQDFGPDFVHLAHALSAKLNKSSVRTLFWVGSF
jgi:hypothetical protein